MVFGKNPSVNVKCPTCGASGDDIVERRGGPALLRCTQCGEKFVFAKSQHPINLGPVDLATPPANMWQRQEFGTISIGKQYGPHKALWFMLPFTVAWVWASSWFSSTFLDEEPVVGVVMFVLFGAAALLLMAFCAMCLAGRVEVRIDGDDVDLFTGVGRFGWRRHFLLSQVQSISHIQTIDIGHKGKFQVIHSVEILMRQDSGTPGRKLRFGVFFLEDEDRAYLCGVLMQLCDARTPPRTTHTGKVG